MAKFKFINRIKSEGKARQTLITQLQTFAFGNGDLDKGLLMGRLKNNLSSAAKSYLNNCERHKRENDCTMIFHMILLRFVTDVFLFLLLSTEIINCQ